MQALHKNEINDNIKREGILEKIQEVESKV